MSDENVDEGPFVRSRYLTDEDMWQAMQKRIERLENLTAQGIHTCSETCQRSGCVQRRKLDAAYELLKKFSMGLPETHAEWFKMVGDARKLVEGK